MKNLKWERMPLWTKREFVKNNENPIIFKLPVTNFLSGSLGIGFYGDKDIESGFWNFGKISAFQGECNFIKEQCLAPFEPGREINFTDLRKWPLCFDGVGDIEVRINCPQLIGCSFTIMLAFYGFQGIEVE